jgi:ribonuclease HI
MVPPPEPPILTVFIDGGAIGNPGAAGAGIYVELQGKPWAGLFEYLGHQTNNYAEYSALLRALEYGVQHGFRKLEVYSDSQLLVRQILGQYRVKNRVLRNLHRKAQTLIGRFELFEIHHIPRARNKKADSLVKKAQTLRSNGEVSYRLEVE